MPLNEECTNNGNVNIQKWNCDFNFLYKQIQYKHLCGSSSFLGASYRFELDLSLKPSNKN